MFDANLLQFYWNMVPVYLDTLGVTSKSLKIERVENTCLTF